MTQGSFQRDPLVPSLQKRVIPAEEETRGRRSRTRRRERLRRREGCPRGRGSPARVAASVVVAANVVAAAAVGAAAVSHGHVVDVSVLARAVSRREEVLLLGRCCRGVCGGCRAAAVVNIPWGSLMLTWMPPRRRRANRDGD